MPAAVDDDRPEHLLRQARKVGLGMLSTRFQRFEVSAAGRQRGPPALSKDPSLFSVVPRPPEGQQPEKRRPDYARFFPGYNRGNPSSQEDFSRLEAQKRRHHHNRAYAVPRGVSNLHHSSFTGAAQLRVRTRPARRCARVCRPRRLPASRSH